MFTGEHLCPNPKNRHTLSLNQRQSWPPSCAALLEREPPHPPTSYMPAFVLISLEKPGASSRGHCEHTCRDPGVHNSLGRGGVKSGHYFKDQVPSNLSSEDPGSLILDASIHRLQHKSPRPSCEGSGTA